MTGKISILAFLSDGRRLSSKCSIQAHDTHFNTHRILDEAAFLKTWKRRKLSDSNTCDQAQHDDPRDPAIWFTPHLYGVLLIDFMERQIYSYNGYRQFGRFDSWALRDDLLQQGSGDDSLAKYSKDIGLNFSDALANGANVEFRGKLIEVAGRTPLQVQNEICGDDPLSLSRQESLDALLEDRANAWNGKCHSYPISACGDVQLQFSDWEIINGDLQAAYEHVSQGIALTARECACWAEIAKHHGNRRY